MVKTNSRVKKGDMLVSGVLGEGAHKEVVVADGMIRGLVWHEYEITVPMLQQYKVYTGLSMERKYIVVANRALQISGYGKLEFAKSEAEVQQNTLHWRNFSLHIGWLHEKLREVHYVKQSFTMQEARGIGLQQARAEISLKSGNDAKIVEEKILHVKSESGKVYIKVLFEVDELISKEQPIIPSIRGE